MTKNLITIYCKSDEIEKAKIRLLAKEILKSAINLDLNVGIEIDRELRFDKGTYAEGTSDSENDAEACSYIDADIYEECIEELDREHINNLYRRVLDLKLENRSLKAELDLVNMALKTAEAKKRMLLNAGSVRE